MQLPSAEDAPTTLGAVLGAFAPTGGLDDLQQQVFDSIASSLYGIDRACRSITPISAARFVDAQPDIVERRHASSLMAVLEMVAHPLRPETAEAVSAYAREAGIDTEVLHGARAYANHHVVAMHADFLRSSWYAKQTMVGIREGRLRELLGNKLAYFGGPSERELAARWQALRDCPPGSWGRGVADFYEAHGFPFPGERHGIYEIGAKHDWVHVLAGYDATPEGEIEVFGFIAAGMPAEEGAVLLSVTLGIFQNGAIHRIGGKKIRMFQTDTLADPNAVSGFAEALRRGARTRVDVMGGIEHFDHAERPLEEVREEFNVVPEGRE